MFPSPLGSKVYKGRYNTFLEEELNQNKQFGDKGQPTAPASNLGKCEYCAFSFKSKTEKNLAQWGVSLQIEAKLKRNEGWQSFQVQL